MNPSRARWSKAGPPSRCRDGSDGDREPEHWPGWQRQQWRKQFSYAWNVSPGGQNIIGIQSRPNIFQQHTVGVTGDWLRQGGRCHAVGVITLAFQFRVQFEVTLHGLVVLAGFFPVI